MLKKIIFSKNDLAGRNIAGFLSTKFSLECVEYCGELIHLNSVPQNLSGLDLLIVASRHKSEFGIPTLTVHSPGNFGAAGAGGREKELGVAPAHYLSAALKALRRFAVPDYEVCFEATHHGPTILGCPIIFVEVGSSEKQWSDLSACKAVAEAINSIYFSGVGNLPAAIGFGGGHYARKFSSVVDYSVGHICSRHSLQFLDSFMVAQMIEKTFPRPTFALVEKKGLGPEKERVKNLLKETSLEVINI